MYITINKHAQNIKEGFSEHGLKHLKAAAAHVLGKAYDGAHILMNHHQVNSEHHHFQRILNSSKGEILKAMKQN